MKIVRKFDPTDPDPQVDISPVTHFRAPLALWVSLLAGIGIIVATAVSTYSGVVSAIKAHTSDVQVHIDPTYHRNNGSPLGQWEFERWKTEFREQVDTLKRVQGEPQSFKDCRVVASGIVRCAIGR